MPKNKWDLYVEDWCKNIPGIILEVGPTDCFPSEDNILGDSLIGKGKDKYFVQPEYIGDCPNIFNVLFDRNFSKINPDVIAARGICGYLREFIWYLILHPDVQFFFCPCACPGSEILHTNNVEKIYVRGHNLHDVQEGKILWAHRALKRFGIKSIVVEPRTNNEYRYPEPFVTNVNIDYSRI